MKTLIFTLFTSSNFCHFSPIREISKNKQTRIISGFTVELTEGGFRCHLYGFVSVLASDVLLVIKQTGQRHDDLVLQKRVSPYGVTWKYNEIRNWFENLLNNFYFNFSLCHFKLRYGIKYMFFKIFYKQILNWNISTFLELYKLI